MALAALRKEAILSPENSPISGSPVGAKRTRRAPAAKSSIGKPALTRVLSDVSNAPQGDIFSPTRTSPSKAPKRQVTEEEAVEPVPWMYIRKYDIDSAKMTYYAQQNGVKITKKQIADTRPVRATEAIRIARDNDVLIVADADGKVQRLNPGGMTDGRLKKAIISSRHDALRAPAYRYGKTFVVGYNEAVNEEVIFGETGAADGSERSKKAKKE